MIQSLYGIACQQLRKWVKPLRDSLYRAYIRTFPCVACGQNWWIDAAHTGPHSYSRKASDSTCIPLCRKCHEAFDQSPARFALVHQMDIEALTTFFQYCYRTEFPDRFQEPAEVPQKKEAA